MIQRAKDDDFVKPHVAKLDATLYIVYLCVGDPGIDH